MKISKKFGLRSLLILLIIAGVSKQSMAQLTGFQSAYFENQYLMNPAMAGLDKGLNIDVGYQQQWTTFPGSPKLQNLTADYALGNRVGVGLIVNSSQAGLISETRIMGTYAYHLPIAETGYLNMGVSFGLNDSYIDYSNVSGDAGDPSVALFNERKIYLDGDVGVSYTSDDINLQAAVPNMGSLLFNTVGTNLDVDRLLFYTAASYKFSLSSQDADITAEPKVAFRGVKGYENIVDGGVNVLVNNTFKVMAMYHTNQSVSAGVGLNINGTSFLFSYTSNTGPLAPYANNTFELGIKFFIRNN